MPEVVGQVPPRPTSRDPEVEVWTFSDVKKEIERKHDFSVVWNIFFYQRGVDLYMYTYIYTHICIYIYTVFDENVSCSIGMLVSYSRFIVCSPWKTWGGRCSPPTDLGFSVGSKLQGGETSAIFGIFTPILGEMIHFDPIWSNFSNGLVKNHQLLVTLYRVPAWCVRFFFNRLKVCRLRSVGVWFPSLKTSFFQFETLLWIWISWIHVFRIVQQLVL